MALVTAALETATDAALGVWLGAMVFLSGIAAPRTFAVLDRDRAGEVVNDVFPRYYAFGVALGVVALGAGAARVAYAGLSVPTATLLLAAGAATALDAYARWGLVPAMERAGENAFETYHRRSVVLNGVAMLAVAAALVASNLA